jgi:hypothetical protein
MKTLLAGRVDELYNLVTGDEDARVCKDIPESACKEQPRNFFAYLFANLFNKIADELTSAKLILPWLMSTLGVPLAFVGFLVPIRETGVLLPQLFVAAAVRHMPLRKPVWLLGGLLSAISLAGMLVVALTLQGVQAGYAIIALLIVFSLSRGLCSVSAKDVLGKTVSKTRRGILMGYSAGFSGLFVLLTGVVLGFVNIETSTVSVLVILLGISVLMWVMALASFAVMSEEPGATEGGGNAIEVALQGLACLKTDEQFRQFVIVRILLLSVALAPPFYVLLAQQWLDEDIGALGYLIIASGIASSISSPFWGKWGDHSSKAVMMSAAGGAALLGILLAVASWMQLPILHDIWLHAVVFMLLIVMHSGVRLGRKVYLVDMATMENRAMYVAVSNTVIGVAMLALGGIGMLTGFMGVAGVIFLLASLALVAMIAAAWLDAA